MRFFLTLSLCTILSFSCTFSVDAEDNARTNNKTRPRIGLVLAGGGALGFAHIGVLRILEENHIPVDLVTGTSMGSIVGAAYASGVTLDEMEELLAETDWDELFDESTARRSQTYRFKPGRDREIYGDTKIGLQNGSIVVPTGVVQGQNVLPLLQRLYEKTRNPADFDKLPLPFRAVTADLETGKAVIPDKGDLATIVRASMSVPGFFAPIELDGKYLVDGGIVNNLPVDVALEMGADVLIVVELYADLSKKEDLGNPLTVAGQIISLLLAQNSEIQRSNMRSHDILIEPNLTGFSSTDFPKGEAIKETGTDAALGVLSKLKKLSVSEEEYAAYQRERTGNGTISAPELIDFVKLDNDSNYPEHRIRTQLGFKAGASFDRTKLEEGIKNLYNTGQFQEVTYSTTTTEKGRGVTIHIKEKEFLKQYLRLGAAFEDDFEGDAFYRLGVDYRYTDFKINGTYVDLQAEIGRNPSITAEWYQPFSNETPYFFTPSASLSRNQLRVTRDGEDIASYQRVLGNVGLGLGREIGTVGEFRVEARRGFGELDREIGSPELSEFSYDTADVGAILLLDALDTRDFPTQGYNIKLGGYSSVEDLGASDDFNTIRGSIALPFTSGRSTFNLTSDFGYTLEDRPVERSFSLGGFFDVPGYQQNTLLASDYAAARLLYYRRFSESKSPLFGLKYFLGGSVNYTTLQSDVDTIPDNRDIVSGLAFIGADTPLFPTYFGVGFAEEGEVAVYLAIGRINIPER